MQSRIGKAEFVPTPPANGEPVEPDIPKDADDKTITRLAALSPIEYDRIRKDEAKKLKCRESTLDSLVQAKRLLMRPSASDNLQGEAVIFTDIEPWPEPVDGAEVLDEISKTFSSYVIQSPQTPIRCVVERTHALFSEFQFRRACRSPLPEASAGKQHCAISSACFPRVRKQWKI